MSCTCVYCVYVCVGNDAIRVAIPKATRAARRVPVSFSTLADALLAVVSIAEYSQFVCVCFFFNFVCD